MDFSQTHIWRGALLSVGVVSAIPLMCLVLVARGRWVASVSHHLMSLAVGALLANACAELIPESITRLGWRPAMFAGVLCGFGGFFLIEQLIQLHLSGPALQADDRIRPYVALNLVGVTLHNALDGMIIAASFQASAGLGIATTIAVVLHEIPHEIGNFGVFVHGGVSPPRAVLLNLLSALAAMAGAIVTLSVGGRSASVAAALLPVAAGSLLYVAIADLIPELLRTLDPASRLSAIMIALGGAAVTVLPMLV